MIKAFKDMITRWNDFKGRTGVADYWLAVLANAILWALIGLVVGIFVGIGTVASSSDTAMTVFTILYIIIGLAAGVVYLWLFVAGLAMTVRRVRDAGFPWWFIFINLVPSIGQIALIVFCCLPSVDEPRIDFGTTNGGAAPTYTPDPAAQAQTPPKPVEPEVIDLEPAEEAPKNDGTWVCPNCGAENSANFCSACGAARP